jgi:hypothetical protein
MTSTDKDYAAAAQWAENDMNLLPGGGPGALHGADAAAFGRSLIQHAVGGRPSIDADGAPSKVAQTRVDPSMDADLTALAHTTGRTKSAIMRAALSEYLSTHRSA